MVSVKLAKPCHTPPGHTPNSNGYVYITVGGSGRRGRRADYKRGRRVSAHRYAWEQAHGPIPRGLFVCHHCDNRACDEIEHLFLGTHRENMADMATKGRGRRPSTPRDVCVNGHELTPENVYVPPGSPETRRMCKRCRRDASVRHKRRRRQR